MAWDIAVAIIWRSETKALLRERRHPHHRPLLMVTEPSSGFPWIEPAESAAAASDHDARQTFI
jgi:hypothetical protein